MAKQVKRIRKTIKRIHRRRRNALKRIHHHHRRRTLERIHCRRRRRRRRALERIYRRRLLRALKRIHRRCRRHCKALECRHYKACLQSLNQHKNQEHATCLLFYHQTKNCAMQRFNTHLL